MINWTDSARETFAHHCLAQRSPLLAAGADPDEVAADLRRHIDEEALAARLTVVTREDVSRILARIAPRESDELQINPPLTPKSKARMPRWVFILAIGFTMIIGLTVVTGILSRAFLGPAPISARLTINEVVQLAGADFVAPGSGVIRFGSAGDPMRASLTGESIKPLDDGYGKKTTHFRAEGRITDANLKLLLNSGQFKEVTSSQ